MHVSGVVAMFRLFQQPAPKPTKPTPSEQGLPVLPGKRYETLRQIVEATANGHEVEATARCMQCLHGTLTFNRELWWANCQCGQLTLARMLADVKKLQSEAKLQERIRASQSLRGSNAFSGSTEPYEAAAATSRVRTPAIRTPDDVNELLIVGHCPLCGAPIYGPRALAYGSEVQLVRGCSCAAEWRDDAELRGRMHESITDFMRAVEAKKAELKTQQPAAVPLAADNGATQKMPVLRPTAAPTTQPTAAKGSPRAAESKE